MKNLVFTVPAQLPGTFCYHMWHAARQLVKG